MGFNPEEFRAPSEESVDSQSGTASKPNDTEGALSSSEMTPEDKEAKEEIEHLVALGLKKLHDFLQTETVVKQGESPGKERLGQFVDQSGILADMEPAAWRMLIDALHSKKDFRGADLPQFIEKGKEVLGLWIHLKGLGLSADRHLAERSGRPTA